MSDLFARPVGTSKRGQEQPTKPTWDKEKMRETALYFLQQGINVIPLPWGRKDSPLVSWKKYQSEKVTPEQLDKWLNNKKWISEHGGINLAVISGKISNLIILDFDVKESYFAFLSSLPKELRDKITSQCVIVETGKGFHVYIRPKNPEKIPNVIPEGQKAKLPGVSVRGEGAYAVAPNSLHPSGIFYRFVNRPERLGEFEDQEIDIILGTVKNINDIVEAGKEVGEVKEDTEKLPEIGPGEWKTLTQEDIDKIVELLRPAYVKNHRHWIRMWLSGWGAFYGVHPLSLAEVFLKLIYDQEEEAKPDFVKKKLGDILDTYKRYFVLTGRKDADQVIENLREEMSKRYGVTPYVSTAESFEAKLKTGEIKGLAGKGSLEEEITASFIEQGRPEEEAKKEANRIIMELKKILGKYRERKKAPGQNNYIFLECIETLEDVCVEWIEAEPLENGLKIYLTRQKNSSSKEPATLRKVMAFIPKEIYHATNIITNKKYYVLKNDGKIVAIDERLDGIIDYLKNTPPWVTPPQLNEFTQKVLKNPKILKKTVEDLMVGITIDGKFFDPYGGLDFSDYGVVGLVEAKKWIDKIYPGPNKVYALINVALLVGKLVSPMIRARRPTYVDYMVYNYGEGGEGKTALFTHIMLPLLDLDNTKNLMEDAYLVHVTGVTSTAQARNLADLSKLPLIIDEQQKESLVGNAQLIIASVVGRNVIGTHAKRFGRGLETKFLSYRGVFVGTNTSFADFLRGVREEQAGSEMALVRRTLPLEWESLPPRSEYFDKITGIKPIYGAIERVLAKPEVMRKVLETSNVIDTARIILEELQEEYGEDLHDYLEALDTARELLETKKKTVVTTDTEKLIRNALEFAKEHLRETNPTRAKILYAILQFPEEAGIGFSYPRNKEERERLIEEERAKIEAMLGDSEEYKELKDYILNTLLSGKKPTPEIVIYGGGNLVKSTPKQFLGKPIRGYGYKSDRHGYKFTLSEFIGLFLTPEAMEEQEEAEKETVEETSIKQEAPAEREQSPPDTTEVTEIKARNKEDMTDCYISLGRILESSGPLSRQELVERLKKAGYTDKAIEKAIKWGLKGGKIAEAGDKIILLNK